MSLIYLDNAATTPIDPRVRDSMLPWIGENYGNPSSVHEAGRKAKVMLEDTRDEFAAFIGARSSEIYFASGGTESNNFAIKGSAFYNLGKKDHIITTAIEHSAVIDTVEYLKARFGFSITYLRTNKYGEIDLNELKNSVTDSTFLVSVMHSNNELGVINDISSIAALLKDTDIMLHSDMIQSLGKVKFDIKETGVNFASFSGHKIYGPKGLGVLYIKKDSPIDKFMHGGKQERDRRGGTENIPAIAGFKKAIELLNAEMDSDTEKASGLRNKLLAELNSQFSDKIIVNSAKEDGVFLPNIVSISFDPEATKIDPDTLLIKLDMKGIMVSSGSACTSGSVQPSHVLKAIGYDDSTARSSIRISFGRFNTEADLDVFIKRLKDIIS